MARVIEVEIEKCMACKACEFACAVEHSTSKDMQKIVKEGEKPGYRISVEAYGRNAVPVNCKHCEEAACIMACPTGAVHRDGKDDPVLVDDERCIGCRMCVMACPFGVITVKSDGKGVLKCDLCVERLAHGEDPACVNACPTSALKLVEEAQSNRAKRKKLAEQMVSAQQENKRDASS
jgi:carbon-monoxide dehydrogenase iron sulfur subunit